MDTATERSVVAKHDWITRELAYLLEPVAPTFDERRYMTNQRDEFASASYNIG
jgi:hypothetical protein